MNVYDFDGTIYKGDSSVDFFSHCVRRHPACALALPRFLVHAASYRAGRCDKVTLKQAFFSFLRWVPSLGDELSLFWLTHHQKIAGWYLEVHEDDDVIISASPRFLLEGACERLCVSNLIASEVDGGTGQFLSPNCRGVEKVRRFNESMPGARIENFYSDSLADAPMARLADRAWLVCGDKVTGWCR